MIDYASVAVSDFEKSKQFYIEALKPLGYTMTMDASEYKAAGFGESGNGDFWIAEAETTAGVHVAIAAKSREAVEAFHAAALAAGGTDNGAPGYRAEYSPGYYGAFIHDYDRNNIEAVWHDPSKG